MDSRDVKTLQILEEISVNHDVSQRHLARKLDISLGMVNSFIRHLASKGYFRAKSLPKKRVRYILTPEGAAEKTRLAYDYIRHSFDQYKKSYGVIQKMATDLVKQGTRTVAVYGVGVISEMICREISDTGIEITALIIDDAVTGKFFNGIKAIGLDEINTVSFDCVILAVYDNRFYSVEKITDAGVSEDRIVTLDHLIYS